MGNFSSVALSENKIFIAYGVNDINTSNINESYLYGLLCTIDGTTITINSNTKLNEDSQSGNLIAIEKLSNDKVFIAHSLSNEQFLCGKVCIIKDANIIKGKDVLLSEFNKIGSMEVLKIEKNNILLTYKTNINEYNLVCKIKDSRIVKRD